jgi:nitrite reductase (NADH) large subunit
VPGSPGTTGRFGPTGKQAVPGSPGTTGRFGKQAVPGSPGTTSSRLGALGKQAVASKLPPERGRKALLVASVAAVTATLVLAIGPEISSARTLRVSAFGRALLRSSTTKQITGYALVALCVLSLGLSLRKRWERFQVADVPFWRAVHGVIAASSLLLFLLHTGLLLGSKLNFLLAVDFFAAVVLGSLSGITAFLAPRWSPLIARDRRLWSARIHLFAMWPLPVLVALHILAAYYY